MSNAEEINLDDDDQPYNNNGDDDDNNDTTNNNDDDEGESNAAVSKMTDAQKKLFALRMKLNAARKANHQGVIEENKRKHANPHDEKLRKKREWQVSLCAFVRQSFVVSTSLLTRAFFFLHCSSSQTSRPNKQSWPKRQWNVVSMWRRLIVSM